MKLEHFTRAVYNERTMYNVHDLFHIIYKLIFLFHLESLFLSSLKSHLLSHEVSSSRSTVFGYHCICLLQACD